MMSIVNVNGRMTVIATTEPSPGKAPMMIPNAVPASIARIAAGVASISRAGRTYSIAALSDPVEPGREGQGDLQDEHEQVPDQCREPDCDQQRDPRAPVAQRQARRQHERDARE